jgi:adenosylhomocysteine nucleosidase
MDSVGGVLQPDLSLILVTFARPEESRAFRRRLSEPRWEQWGRVKIIAGRIGAAEVACVHTGIGDQAASRVAREVLVAGKCWTIIGAGFAGGLAPALGPGDVVLEDHFENPGGPRRIISRAWPVETVEQKAALFQETGAQAVDMETESLHTACRTANVPFMAVRAISDPANEPLPVPFEAWFHMERQRVRPLALLAWLARHPSRIAPFTRFVRRLPQVGKALAFGLEGVIRGMMNH